jgi:hypothetical protein
VQRGSSCVARLLVLRAGMLMSALDKEARTARVFLAHHVLRFPPSIPLLLIFTGNTRRSSQTTASQMPHVSRTTTPACRSTTSGRAPRTSAGSPDSLREVPDMKVDAGSSDLGALLEQVPGKHDIGSLPHPRLLAHVRPGSSPRCLRHAHHRTPRRA